MSYSATKTWVSDQTRENETYKRILDQLRHVAPKSPVLPTTFKDWLAHQHAMVEKKKADEERKLQQIVDSLRYGRHRGREGELRPAFNGTKFNDGLSSVLAKRTIWLSRGIEPANPHAPWPSNDELKHSGVYRASSGQHRAVPHPRMNAGLPVGWQEKPLVAFSPFDDTGLNKDEGDEDEDEEDGNEDGNDDADDEAEIPDGAEFLGFKLLKELDI